MESDLNAVVSGYMRAKTVNMDGATEWGPPSVSGQFGDDALWEQDGWAVKVFDMSKEEDMKAYEELLTQSAKEDPEVIIIDQDKQYCESLNSWKVFITSVGIKYKKLVKNKNEENQ